MGIDASIPLRAAQGAQFNLADMYAQAQNMNYRQQAMDMQRQQMEAQQAEREKAAQREQAGMIAKLTQGVNDEATYQQRLAAARQYGIDVSEAPTSYDPQWVQTQNIIASTFLKPDGEKSLSTAAQQAQELTGLPISDPKARAVMANILSKTTSVEAGGSVYSNSPLTGMSPVIVPNDGTQQQGAPVENIPTINSPDEARRLPPGTQFRTPDGRVMRVPGGTVSNGGGGF